MSRSRGGGERGGGGWWGKRGRAEAAVDEKKKTTQAVKHDTRNMLYWSYYIEKEQARKWGREKNLLTIYSLNGGGGVEGA